MDTDLSSLLMAGIGICIVLAGIIVGAIVLSTRYPGITIPSSSFLLLILVFLAVLIVVFAAVVVMRGQDTEGNRGRP